MLSQVVVVGGSAAGLSAVETLRREGYDGPIALIGDEVHLPYDRPPLSKQILKGVWESTRLALRPSSALNALEVEWLLNRRAESLDMQQRVVRLSNGCECQFDGLIIATGVTPRRLAAGHELANVHTLRSLEDAAKLREGLLNSRSVVIVGAGFLGAEVAAAAREMGRDVVLVDPLAAPMVRQLGAYVGSRFADLHREKGVSVRCGVGVQAMLGRNGTVSEVVLSDGSAVPADLVLVAIGSVPATDWLAGSGLPLTNGVDCDEFCQAAPGVVAAGDVASWLDPELGRVRVEHRMNATEQGIAAARTLLGRREPFRPVPYFWSDQFTIKLQAYGSTGADLRFHPVQVDGKNRFSGVYESSGRVVGALAWNMAKEARTLRTLVVERAPIDSVAGIHPPQVSATG